MVKSSNFFNAKILIVDDLEPNVRLLGRMLGGAGYASISSTMDPQEVCALHRKNGYDLILLDLQMPGMDGFQVIEGLKEIAPAAFLPVLVITAEPAHKLRALQAGAKDFITKPFELADVLARVHNILEVCLLHGETQNYNKALEQMVQELNTLNAELSGRNHELSEVNDDLTNLIRSVNIPIVMVDTKLNIRRFTPHAENVLNLMPSDMGRPISEIKTNIEFPQLEQVMRNVIASGNASERDLQDQVGKWYSLRVLPYQTQDGKITGAVLALLAINQHEQRVEPT